MEIKIGNVLAALFMCIALGVYLKMAKEIVACLATVQKMGPGNHPDDRLTGLIALGVICVCLLGALRLIIHERNR